MSVVPCSLVFGGFEVYEDVVKFLVQGYQEPPACSFQLQPRVSRVHIGTGHIEFNEISKSRDGPGQCLMIERKYFIRITNWLGNFRNFICST